jgi:hypothetical protein
MSSTRLDIEQVNAPAFGPNGAIQYNVAASATLIYPGEPAVNALGGVAVTPMATNKPVVATDYLCGIATTTSTNTAGAAGKVFVQPLIPGQVWMINPNSAAAYDTQSEYDAIVGKRVLIDLTAGKYTLLAADAATSGCIVLAKNVKENPGKIYFTFRNGVNYLS